MIVIIVVAVGIVANLKSFSNEGRLMSLQGLNDPAHSTARFANDGNSYLE